MTTFGKYDVIVQELEKLLQQSDKIDKPAFSHDKPMELKEFYTVHFGGPRQSGKTRTLLEMLIRNPNGILATVNDTLKQNVLAMARHYADVNDEGEVNTGFGDTYKIRRDLVGIINSYANLVENITERTVTHSNLLRMVANDERFSHPLSRVMIDCNKQCFSLMRYSKYYTWLAKQSAGYTSTWMVD